MSFGALSGPAVEALNRGAAIAGCWQNTGEGGISPYHLSGGDLVWQIGTGYFGCRELDGRFSMSRLVETTTSHPNVRAIEILDDRFGSKTVAEIFGGRGLGLPPNDQERTPSPIAANMRPAAAPSFR